MPSVYPWLMPQWQYLQQLKQQQHLPHALLFSGLAGMGKQDLAMQFAQSLLCARPTDAGMACSSCESCRLWQANTHPDFFGICSDDGHSLKIDDIRKVIQQFHQHTHTSAYRVLIISPAELMTRGAANALLKTLEEPSGQSLIILVSHQLTAVPPTIRSRCQRLDFPAHTQLPAKQQFLAERLPQADATNLLRYSEGAPLTALALAEPEVLENRQTFLALMEALCTKQHDPVSAAESLQSFNFQHIVAWLQRFLHDLIAYSQGIAKDFLIDADIVCRIVRNHYSFDARKLYPILDRLNELHRLSYSSVNLNVQLQCEDLLFRLARAMK